MPGIAWKMAAAAGGAGEAMEKVGGPEGSKEGWDDTVESENTSLWRKPRGTEECQEGEIIVLFL